MLTISPTQNIFFAPPLESDALQPFLPVSRPTRQQAVIERSEVVTRILYLLFDTTLSQW
jgi:hypothetical protein